MSDRPGLEPGALLDGKYEILGLLGAGGMGEVYKARHVHLGAFRCIKVMKPSTMADATYRQRFLREARLATQIHHPNVAVVHDFSILPDGASYMVTEFIDGTTVRQWEAANGRFPLALALEVARQTLAGLDAIHRRGMLHRDVSADNVMLAFDEDDRLTVKIIDLGVAKEVRPSVSVDATQAGVFIGNPKYMSPEQLGDLDEGESLDARADLYSLGVVLYEMLTGVPPFVARTTNAYVMKHLTEPPRAFREANPAADLPPGLEQIVFRALEKKRERRFSDAREFADAIAQFAQAGDATRDGFTAADQAWALAFAAGSARALREFGERFPMHRTEEVQRALVEREAFDEAEALDTVDGWLAFLQKHAKGRLALKAAERYDLARAVAAEREAAAYEDARALDSIDGWAMFLLNHPAGDHAAAAKERLAWLETAEERRALARRAMMEGDFSAAFESGTTSAWDAWLSQYPDSPRIGEARVYRQEAAEFELAASMNTRVMWRAFVKAWPDGRHRLDAELRLRSA